MGTHNFPDLLTQLYFILGQLENSIVKRTRRRFNIITMILSLNSHSSSHACYKQLQNMDCISCPTSHHYDVYTLVLVSTKTRVFTFLKAETNDFNQFELHLCLNMDEIHIKSNITYKS